MTATKVESIDAVAERAIVTLREALAELAPSTRVARMGTVTAVADGVVEVVGLDDLVSGELLDIAGIPAVAEEVAVDHARAVLLGRTSGVEAGASARRVGRLLDVPSDRALIGRVVDPLGEPIDGLGPIGARRRSRIDADPVALQHRELVSRPLRTGVFAVDTMIPIGRGQRQLIVGDRATGKTELCLGLLAGLDRDVIGVYVAIAARGADTAAHVARLRARGFFEHGFVVATDADAPTGLVQLAPYAACAMAEALAHDGHDVVIVYDDLTRHAHAHRSAALLLGRPVGREAHPVDVFHAHARLLERAAQFGARYGGGSLTALPIIETQAGDLTAYIPTNLVSITDGQLRLDAGLLAAGVEPPIDIGMSVSRVGGKAQPAIVRAAMRSFKNRYAQFLELESFARFGSQLEVASQVVVEWGRRVRLLLDQGSDRVFSYAEVIARLLIVESPELNQIALGRVVPTVDEALERLWSERPQLRRALDGLRASVDDVAALRPRVTAVLRAAAGLATEAPRS